MAVSSQVASISIVLGTRSPQAASFNAPAIFCDAPYVGGRTYELSSEGLASMVTDGFAVTDRGYLLASSMASQSPHADQVLVYARAALTTNILHFTPLDVTVGAVYEFDLTYKGITSTITYTVATGTVDAICDDLKALINASAAGTAGVAAVGDVDPGTATKLILTGGTDGEPVQISGLPLSTAKILDASADAGIATDLAAAAGDPALTFYQFVIDSYSEAENNAAAAWAEANSKIFLAHSADSTNVLDSAGTGVGQDFFAALYNRSAVWHNGDMAGNAAACICSRQAALSPGESGYAFKVLAGPEADALTATHISNAKGKNVNLYALDSGTAHTWFGVAASGRSLRVQTALDLLNARIGEAILAAFMSNEYIPMDDDGFAVMQSVVQGVLNGFVIRQVAGQQTGFIQAGSITVSVPKASSLSNADKVAGKLTPLKFGCTIPNDMQRVVVQGAVSL